MRDRLFHLYKVMVFFAGLYLLRETWGVYQPVFRIEILLFVALLWANNHEAISINEAVFSVNFPLLFPVITQFGPFWAGVVAGLGIIDLQELKSHWTVVAFNRGSVVLSAVLASLVFNSLPANLNVLILVSTLAFIACNTGVYVLARLIAGAKDRDFFYYALDALKTFLPSGALAFMFYHLYLHFSVWGVIAAYIVFLAVRSNVMFHHIEHKYRIALIRSLLRATQSKDDTLVSHLERVAYYSKHLARKCGYPLWRLHVFDEACYLHDIGKLEIADAVLKKPGRLTAEEYEIIKTHPLKGVEFIESIPIEENRRAMIKNIVKYHHERYDGRGYPSGLAGEDIPLEARIVAVADTWDAMTGERCYRKPLSRAEALEELKRARGTQLDPRVVDIFVGMIDDIDDLTHQEKDVPSVSSRPLRAESVS